MKVQELEGMYSNGCIGVYLACCVVRHGKEHRRNGESICRMMGLHDMPSYVTELDNSMKRLIVK